MFMNDLGKQPLLIIHGMQRAGLARINARQLDKGQVALNSDKVQSPIKVENPFLI